MPGDDPAESPEADEPTTEIEAQRAGLIDDPEVPEVVRNFLAAGASLEEIRLDRRGVWRHRGEPFDHPRLIERFHQALRPTERGHHLIELGRFTYPVVVEGTWRFVNRARIVDDGGRGALRCQVAGGDEAIVAWSDLVTDGERFVGARLPTSDGGAADGPVARFVDEAHRVVLDRVELDGEGRWGVRALDGELVPMRSLEEEYPAVAARLRR